MSFIYSLYLLYLEVLYCVNSFILLLRSFCDSLVSQQQLQQQYDLFIINRRPLHAHTAAAGAVYRPACCMRCIMCVLSSCIHDESLVHAGVPVCIHIWLARYSHIYNPSSVMNVPVDAACTTAG
jgi:hypothetical protein